MSDIQYCGNRWAHGTHVWWNVTSHSADQYRCAGFVGYDLTTDDWAALRGGHPIERNKIMANDHHEIDIEREPANMVAGPYGPTFPQGRVTNPNYHEPDPNDPSTNRRAAERFLADCGLPLVPDAVDQLADAFLPALRIICERGWHPEGNTWREAGWRGMLYKIREKSARLWYRSWVKGGYDSDSSMDLINFAGFYYRLGNQGKEWGEWGEPGHRVDRKYPIPSEEEAEAAKQRVINTYQGKHVRKVKDNPQA